MGRKALPEKVKQNRLSTRVKKKAVIEALSNSLGNVSVACKDINISRLQYYKWIKEDAAFKADVDAIIERQKDFVEGALLKRIKEGSDAAIIFYAKTKMKDRGYVEKLEIESENKTEITVKIVRGNNIKPESASPRAIGSSDEYETI